MLKEKHDSTKKIDCRKEDRSQAYEPKNNPG